MTSSDSSGLPAPTIRMPKSKAWVLPVLIVPLISYAILATIAVAILYMRLQNVRDPLEVLPDMGDYKGGTRIKSSAFMPRLPDPIKSELSAKLKVALGNTIRIGDLEVTPGKVQRRKIKYHQEGNARGEDSRQEALVLELRLRNVSDDVAFRPMDPFFTRKWKEKDGGIGPYTFLTVGDKHFYGGPLDANERHTHLMSVLGQNFDRELLPGEEMTTFICTDPDDSIQSALEKVKGSKAFLWRIQVRRGLVKVGDRDISATAVIGVEFNRQNIQ